MISMSGEGGSGGGEVEMEGEEQEVIRVRGETQEISCSSVSGTKLFRFSSTCAGCCCPALAGPRLGRRKVVSDGTSAQWEFGRP